MLWFHIDCKGVDIDSFRYRHILDSNVTWNCPKCDLPNYSTTLFNDTPTEISNTYSSLDLTMDSQIPGSPQATSSPIHQKNPPRQTNHQNKPKGPQRDKTESVRVLIVNCQSLGNKKSHLETVIKSSNPDIIIGTESWLEPKTKSSEFFPANFQVFRKDRQGDAHGGVFIAIKDTLHPTEAPELDVDAELVWARIDLVGHRSLHLASFYRPPKTDDKYLKKLDASLSRISNTNGSVWVGGDFNLPDINWDVPILKTGSNNPTLHQDLIDMAAKHSLDQVVDKPTRGPNTLDLLFTNNKTAVNKVETLPPLGKSDHDIVFLNISLQPTIKKQKPRKIYLYDKADFSGMEKDLSELASQFEHLDTSQYNTEELWTMFKN